MAVSWRCQTPSHQGPLPAGAAAAEWAGEPSGFHCLQGTRVWPVSSPGMNALFLFVSGMCCGAEPVCQRGGTGRLGRPPLLCDFGQVPPPPYASVMSLGK